jgi:hypothetical protein
MDRVDVYPHFAGLVGKCVCVTPFSEAAAAKTRAEARAAKAASKTLKSAQETVPPETYEQRDSGEG